MPLIDNWHIDALAIHLQAVAEGKIRFLLVNIGPGYAKPVHDESMILMADGTYKRIDEITVGDLVIAHSGCPRRVEAVHVQGDLECVEIATASGRTITAALDHPFLTPEGWVSAGDLQVGQRLALVATSRTISTKPYYKKEEFALAGYFVGDGCTAPAGTSFAATITTNGDDLEVVKHIQEAAESLGFKTIQRGHKRANIVRTNVSSGVRPWLESIGLDRKTSYTKVVPDFVYRGTNEQIVEFIAAYFECDGAVKKKAADRRHFVVTFNSVSSELLRGVQRLLCRLGINSIFRRRQHVNGTAFTEAGYTYYDLAISDEDNVAKFFKLIPVRGIKARKIKDNNPLRHSFAQEFIPDEVVGIVKAGPKPCRCLTVEVDHTFTIENVVVHNSVIASVMFSAWLWARNPATRIIAATYASQLTIRDSIRTRDLITSDWFQDTFNPGWSVSREMKESERLRYMSATDTWEMVKENEDWLTNDKKGERRALSIGGKATGFRADGQIFDDLLNATDRHSKPARDDARDWAISTMSSRFNDMRNGWRVVIGQRLHEDDPYGAMLKTGRYEHLCLPSEFDPERRCVTSIGWQDPRQEAGELLFPELFTKEVLAQAKIDLGSYDYAGQHQQRPAPAEGGIFNRNWWQYYKIGAEPQFEMTVITVDAAFKDKATSDDVAIQVWSFIGPRSYLRKEVADKMGFGATKAAVKSLALEWKPAGILIEDKANGSAVIEELKKELSGVIAIEPEGGKIARAWAVQPTTEAGNIFLPDDGSAGPLVEECAVFPNGSQDNRVDAFTQVINWRRKRMFSLGLVDYLKQEQQKANDEVMNKINATRDMSKPATGENTLRCGKCEGSSIAKIGGSYRCSSCGYQWSVSGKEQKSPMQTSVDVRKIMEKR